MRQQAGWVVVLSTAGNIREAHQVSRHLLRKRLAGCVNIVPHVRSSYWWKGKIESASECLLVIKSRANLFKKIHSEIKQISSYDCPEVIALKVRAGSKDYLSWLTQSLKPSARKGKQR
jgi:periplasmic divalent cation tolerance protein